MQLPNFDTLRDLAEQQPEELEALRQRHIAALITRSNPASQRRLKGLQFQIDGLRQRHRHPLAACIKISSLMKQSARDLLAELHASSAPHRASKSAAIVPFNTRK
ncbi:DUF3135 domain-containing protein [Simiduia aestuariiviva]|uniref:DUF3135 domain-containing protein n=1 Tax=Simiduia aestuariiviva TaxID=1510459 RepID=A0A839UNB0_9GAMM|nr:hypothetical protein [Simiduia aestuariiviva]